MINVGNLQYVWIYRSFLNDLAIHITQKNQLLSFLDISHTSISRYEDPSSYLDPPIDSRNIVNNSFLVVDFSLLDLHTQKMLYE